MCFNTFFVLLSAASALALVTPFKRDVPAVKADLDDLYHQFGILYSNANSGPPTKAVAEIIQRSNLIVQRLEKATTDTRAIATFNEADGKSILASYERCRDRAIAALRNIIGAEPRIRDKAHAEAVIVRYLDKLKPATSKFSDALSLPSLL
ncbi:hypothetical protein AAF712_014147 [Marasmius tenuissimus]|uniref:Uncharacterized protein n=1 Tax=Marasmius tenuissimus TaxID=585030 RepID=A0ABR2ZFA0_9AGAR